MDFFQIKNGDTQPSIEITMQHSDGTAIDLSNGSVWFHMGNITDYSAFASGLCMITGSTTGEVKYNWTTSDTSTTGVYFGEFRASWVGSQITLPYDNSLKIKVHEDYD